MTTEKELHSLDGFSNRQHKPDFIFKQNGELICVEVELSVKAKARLEKNLKDNFMKYEKQIWVTPNSATKINKTLKDNIPFYPNINIIPLEEVKKNVIFHI